MEVVMCVTVLFSKAVFAETHGVSQPDPLITATLGDNVTLHCRLMEKVGTDPIVWYKQPRGQEPRIMALLQIALLDPFYYNEFKTSRITVERRTGSTHLNIANVEPLDEAMYYCGLRKYGTLFGKGTFLALRGHTHAGVNVSVHQSAVSSSAGGSVSVQCSVVSESRAGDLQELRVLWLRAAAGESHPEIIYTHHNSSHQCEISSSMQRCVYKLSENTHSLQQIDTYYCAVVMCGRIIFGNGTRVQIDNSPDHVVMFLGAALVVCVILISALAILICKISQHCFKSRVQTTVTENPSNQNHQNKEMNYAALHFSENKSKIGRRAWPKVQDPSVYSEVRYSTVTDRT